jgi:hypothetical protein
VSRRGTRLNPNYVAEDKEAFDLVKLSGIVPTEDVETNPHVYLQTDREWFWERAFGDYTPGRYAWKLTELHKLREPIPVSGNRMLWKPGRITLDWINKQEGMKL